MEAGIHYIVVYMMTAWWFLSFIYRLNVCQMPKWGCWIEQFHVVFRTDDGIILWMPGWEIYTDVMHMICVVNKGYLMRYIYIYLGFFCYILAKLVFFHTPFLVHVSAYN